MEHQLGGNNQESQLEIFSRNVRKYILMKKWFIKSGETIGNVSVPTVFFVWKVYQGHNEISGQNQCQFDLKHKQLPKA